MLCEDGRGFDGIEKAVESLSVFGTFGVAGCSYDTDVEAALKE